jgi:hypothetical protein
VTAANLGEDHSRDEPSWLDLFAEYQRIRDPLLETLLTAWPPVRAGLRLHKRLGGTAELVRFSRFLALPSARMGAELFRGRRGRTLLAGNAMHADIPPTAPGSGLFGWLMMMLAQDVGFPVPVGGAGKLVEALAARASLSGADIRVGSRSSRSLRMGPVPMRCARPVVTRWPAALSSPTSQCRPSTATCCPRPRCRADCWPTSIASFGTIPLSRSTIGCRARRSGRRRAHELRGSCTLARTSMASCTGRPTSRPAGCPTLLLL